MDFKKNENFSSLSISKSLLQVILELGFTQLTPIQAQSIPALLEGKDIIGQSRTGSGKTVAFSIPVLEKINLRERRVQALILCPTRELCTQVAREIRKLGRRHPSLQVLILSGGLPIYPQLNALRKGVHVVVGTPGRVLDHLGRNSLDLSQIQFLILDEADRMLEMGFQEDMERILEKTPKNRQTVLFSATYPKTIELLSRAYQTNPIRVTIEDEVQEKPSIQQIAFETHLNLKFDGLLWILQHYQPESALVFCNLKASVMELSRQLNQKGISAACLHGDLEQYDRDRIMAKFRNHSTRILIATDVAARGLDVENLDIVINYDFPARPEIYVHRIGRTGRAGKKGIALSFITPKEKGKIQTIESYTGSSLEISTRDEFNSSKNSKENLSQEAPMVTLFISGGRKEKVRPADILGALTGEAGRLQGSQIGKIEIHDHFSYVAVEKSIATTAIQRLREGRIKGKKFRIELVR